MKMIVFVALALVACAAAAPPANEAQVLRYSVDQNPDGAFSYGYEVDNGIKAEATGELKSVVDENNKPQQILVVRGYYVQLDEQGQPQTITYQADENGYQAQGPAIPQAPVARRLTQQLSANPRI